MIYYPIAFFVLAALFLFQTFLFYRQNQEIKKLRHQRDVFRRNFGMYSLYDTLPADVCEVLDEIEGR